jgi:excisionase family DNA binding protein
MGKKDNDNPSGNGSRSITGREKTTKASRNAAENSTRKKKKRRNPVEELGESLGLARSTTYELLKRGELPGSKFGGRWIIPKNIVERIQEEAWRTWQLRRKTKSDSDDDSES